ncbi:hypothetical protein EDD11_008971 [Mortierella claussenii]|nr:hypothetical protein EDD11_008971 [Mortierella claussenii]
MANRLFDQNQRYIVIQTLIFLNTLQVICPARRRTRCLSIQKYALMAKKAAKVFIMDLAMDGEEYNVSKEYVLVSLALRVACNETNAAQGPLDIEPMPHSLMLVYFAHTPSSSKARTAPSRYPALKRGTVFMNASQR